MGVIIDIKMVRMQSNQFGPIRCCHGTPPPGFVRFANDHIE
jgi:hypothetical protein